MLMSRRVLLQRARADVPLPSRTLVAVGGGASRLIGSGTGAMLLFNVPVLTPEESLVARVLVCLRSQTAPDRAVLATKPASLACLCPIVLRSLRRQLARMRSRLQRAAGARLNRERLIASVALHEEPLTEAQPGLFDRRELDAFVELSGDQRRVQADARARMTELEQAGNIRLGEPQLELVISTPDTSS
jgi:hypothetical protein